MVIPANSTEGRDAYGKVRRCKNVHDTKAQRFEYAAADMSPGRMTSTFEWLHGNLTLFLTRYEWQEGQIDKEGFVAIRVVELCLPQACNNSCSDKDNDGVQWPTRQLLPLFLLIDNSGNFEEWVGISPVYLAE